MSERWITLCLASNTNEKHELRGEIAREAAEPHDRDGVVSATKKWLTRCNKHHGRCHGTDLKPLPKRLVSIEGTKTKLVETKQGEQGVYTALSYSWGDSSGAHYHGGTRSGPLKLLAKNHANLLQNIDASRLSKAHQHGIQVARELGYRYIWIDALCILQDNQDDWKEQSKSTAEVYGNADLTIVAGRSDDSRHGFLKPLHDPGVYVQVPYLSADRPDLKTCCIGRPRNHRVGPTTGRGWCYQEVLMSRRMIIYGEQQLSFRCRERHDFEDGHFEFVGASDDWYDLAFQNLGDTSDKT